MGKASRRKHANEQQRLYFDIKDDARSTADRARARATLDALQQKLVDDALREDGFYFVDGKYMDARRPRFTPGMKTQTFNGHARRITDVATVPMTVQASTSQDLNSFVVTFGTDCVCVWNMKTGERLGVLDTKSLCAVSICGAATRTPAGSPLWIAFATHLHPNIVVFDPDSSQFQPHHGEIAKTFDFGVGHQQQITCMSFTHSGDPMLATGSLDSTCIVWTISGEDRRPTLEMRMMLPVADAGVFGCVFTSDDQDVVSVGGDGTVKVWRIDGDNAKESKRLHQQHEEWQHAAPFTLTIAHTRDLLLFDGIPPSFHGNDEWLLHDRRSGLGKTDLLQAPLAGEILQKGRDYSSMPPLQTCEREQNNGKPPEPSKPQLVGILGDDKAASQSNEEVVDAVERLRREYETMETFDFERLLNPAGLVLDGIGGEPKGLESIKWPLLTQDAHGRLLKMFTRRKENGEYAGHTSHVADCAVALESDLVVTVSFDKSVICWSLSMGIVQSITRGAHAAPITSCALTSPTTCQPKDLELLLATSGKDNLVKVWHLNKRGDNAGCYLECVYALTGHYDAISALTFDASGVFLLSASDDTLAHCWRVRPAPPDAPAQPTVVNIDRFAISIAWNVPLANGSALLKYIVRTEQLSSLASDGSDKKPVKDHDVDIKYKTATVDSLQPGIQYRLCVAAVNSVGQSQWSEFTDVVETMAFAPSQIDKAVLYRDITATSVRLSWKAPCANGAPITSYTVKSLPENTLFAPTMETPISVSDLSIVIPDPEASRRRHAGKLKVKSTTVAKRTELGPIVYEYVLDGLWPGEVYQFIVAAENRCGLGGFSPFSDYIKMESTAPDAPAMPQLTSVGKRQAEAVWIKPRSNGSEILQYIIEWTQETELSRAAEDDAHHPTTSRTSVTMLTKSIVGTTYKIAGLRPGRPLRVWIAATNLVNGKLTASPFSEPSDAVCTLCDVPDPPKKPRIESPTPHSIVIAVDPPCDNGAGIELYQITLFTEELQFGIATKKIVREVALAPDEFDATEQSGDRDRWLRFTAFKLRAKTFYSATVVARNALGWSQVSASSVAVSTRPPSVPATIPMAPQIRDIEPTQAKISWSTPSHDGGAALASMVLQYRINNGEFEHEIVLFQGSELVVEHLKPRTTYAFRVVATNAVGRADFSPACEPFTTPSLVDFTIAKYFASRPEIEHIKATVLQRRYRLWKRRTRERRVFLEQLTSLLASSWHIL